MVLRASYFSFSPTIISFGHGSKATLMSHILNNYDYKHFSKSSASGQTSLGKPQSQCTISQVYKIIFVVKCVVKLYLYEHFLQTCAANEAM